MKILSFLLSFSLLFFFLVGNCQAQNYLSSVRTLFKKNSANIKIHGKFIILEIQNNGSIRKLKIECLRAPLYEVSFKGDLVEKRKLNCSYIKNKNIRNVWVLWSKDEKIKEIDIIPGEGALQ